MIERQLNIGQILIADDHYFYVLRCNGFHVFDANDTSKSEFVHCVPEPKGESGKKRVHWRKIGWLPHKLILLDQMGTMFHIPRHVFPAEHNWSVGKRVKLGVWTNQFLCLGDKYIPKAADVAECRRMIRYPDFQSFEPWFTNCLRTRTLIDGIPARYSRKDEVGGRAITVPKPKGNLQRNVAVVGDQSFCFKKPNVNDVCFSNDGMVAHILHEDGSLVSVDVD